MTATNEDLRRPVPLRVFLEAGCDPASVGLPVWDHWQDDLRDFASDHIDHWAQRVAWYRYEVDATLEGRDPTPGMFGEHNSLDVIARNWGGLQRYVTAASWQADLYEDPGLAELLQSLLTAEQRAEHAKRVANAKAPHPLVVGPLDSGEAHCLGCGVDCSDLAMSVGYAEGFSDEPDLGGGYCFSCVTITYEAMKAAQG